MKENSKILKYIPLLGILTACENQTEFQLSPNIIFILCDDLGYGDIGAYGQEYIRTPRLDSMAAQGIRFNQAYAGSPVSAPPVQPQERPGRTERSGRAAPGTGRKDG